MPKRRRGKWPKRKAKKTARVASHNMRTKVASMDDAIENLGISLLAIGWTPLKIAEVMFFLQHNTAKVAEMVQEMPDSPTDSIFRDMPKTHLEGFLCRT